MQKRDLYYERIPTKLLRDDVRYLGNILGKVIKEQEGQKFFDLVEKVRKLSKANKTSINTKQTNRKVIKAIQDLDPKNTFKLTRAFTHFMNFINLAELIDASRSLNEYENKKKFLIIIYLLKKYLKVYLKVKIFLIKKYMIQQKI